MPRGHSKIKKKAIEPDKAFGSALISKFTNYVMLNGKKTVARRIVTGAFNKAAKELNIKPLDVLETTIKNVGPLVEVKGKRIGGANYQIPVEVNKKRKIILTFRWILEAARGKKGKPMQDKLAQELISACKGEGSAIKKREDIHKMAEANKAFAHFARF